MGVVLSLHKYLNKQLVDNIWQCRPSKTSFINIFKFESIPAILCILIKLSDCEVRMLNSVRLNYINKSFDFGFIF